MVTGEGARVDSPPVTKGRSLTGRASLNAVASGLDYGVRAGVELLVTPDRAGAVRIPGDLLAQKIERTLFSADRHELERLVDCIANAVVRIFIHPRCPVKGLGRLGQVLRPVRVALDLPALLGDPPEVGFQHLAEVHATRDAERVVRRSVTLHRARAEGEDQRVRQGDEEEGSKDPPARPARNP